jgi:ribose transport system substrate-binding protein
MALAATLVMAGCSGGSSSGGSSTTTDSGSTASGGKKLTLAVIPKGATHEYWKLVHEGVNKAAAEDNVDIKWKSAQKEDDRNGQISVVESFITSGVDGIALAPLDNIALEQPVKEALAKKIPVVIFDSALNDVKTTSFVATDNEKGGHIAGKEMADVLKGKGNIIMLRYEEGSASTMAREKGFLDEIAKNPGIKVVKDNEYGGATSETAQKASENLLADLKKPDGSLSIDGIYCPNESTTFGMLRVLEDGGNAGKVHFVGFDSSDKLIAALSKGEIDGLVVQNPRKMGYLSVKALVDAIHGKTVDQTVDTGATLVTKANMSQPDIAELIAPPKE